MNTPKITGYCLGDGTKNQALSYAVDTQTGIAKGALRVNTGSGAAVGEDGSTRCYIHPGDKGGTGYHTDIDAFYFSIDTTGGVLKSATSQALAYSSISYSEGGIYRLCGSVSGTPVATTDHIAFANDTATAVVKGSMPQTSSSCTATQR